jgi:hypothetical protein
MDDATRLPLKPERWLTRRLHLQDGQRRRASCCALEQPLAVHRDRDEFRLRQGVVDAYWHGVRQRLKCPEEQYADIPNDTRDSPKESESATGKHAHTVPDTEVIQNDLADRLGVHPRDT